MGRNLRLVNMTVVAKCDKGVKRKNGKFSGTVKKMTNSTLLLFENGSVVSVGGKSHENVICDLTSYTKSIKGTILGECIVRNLVYVFELSRKVDLTQVYNSNKSKLTLRLEPELCPALYIKLHNCSILLHTSGKSIITGCRDLESAEQGAKLINEICI